MAGAVSNKHPDYIDRFDEWKEMRDAARGERAVKAEGELYLPMPDGFSLNPRSAAMYSAYQTRAQFSEILAPTIRGMVGVIHRTEAQIDMPAAMQGLWERATGDGLPLEALHRRITGELLLTGRYGLLAEASSKGSDLPWLAGYSAEALINWSEGRDFYVLDESGLIRDEFQWREQKRYRVLRLDGGRYIVSTYTGEEKDSEEIQPTARGGAVMTEIPFVVMGPRDLSVAPSEPPLIGVARAALAMYRLDADYRHQLYMSGQETLVVVNGPAPAAIGAGVVLTLESGADERGVERTPDAFYIGPEGTGIEAHRTAIQDERDNAASAGARLFDAEKKSAESGDALRIRYAAQTATLTSIAQASAQGLEKALRHIAVMIGVDPNTVVVRPNLSFIDATLSPTDAAALMALWQGGSISYQTFYEQLQKGEIASAERDHEAELKLIDAEQMGEDEDRQAALGSTPE